MGQRKFLFCITLLVGLIVTETRSVAQNPRVPRTRPSTGTTEAPSGRTTPRRTQPVRTPAPAAANGQAPAGDRTARRPQPRPAQSGPATRVPRGQAPGNQVPAAGVPGTNVPVRAPAGFPLSAEEQQRVDQILAYWEFHTDKIKTHQCTFWRENYDFVFGKQDVPRTVEKGMIRYRAPDKGLMRVDDVYKVTDPQAADWRKALEKEDVQFGEHWVCDGEAIYQYDTRTKTLTETQLPPDMRGKAIGDGPLPFLFGAEAAKMKERYWIREKKPDNNPNGEYFLEAIPKRPEDAANFERIWIQLATDGSYLFPKVMRVYNKQGYVKYSLIDHAPNATQHRIAGFLNSFVSPKTPPGWKKVVENWNGQPAEEVPRQAENPRAGNRR